MPSPVKKSLDCYGTLKWAPETGPRAKVYNGVKHQACGGAVRWSRNSGGDSSVLVTMPSRKVVVANGIHISCMTFMSGPYWDRKRNLTLLAPFAPRNDTAADTYFGRSNLFL